MDEKRVAISKKVNKLKRFITRKGEGTDRDFHPEYFELEKIKKHILQIVKLESNVFKRINDIELDFKKHICKQEEMSSQEYQEMYDAFPDDF